MGEAKLGLLRIIVTSLVVSVSVVSIVSGQINQGSHGNHNRQTLVMPQDNQDEFDSDTDERFNVDLQQHPPLPFPPQCRQLMQHLFGNGPWNNGHPQNGSPGLQFPPIMGPPGMPIDVPVKRAVALLNVGNSTGTISGIVVFTEDPDTGSIVVTGNVTGLAPNTLHGFHVHEVCSHRKTIRNHGPTV